MNVLHFQLVFRKSVVKLGASNTFIVTARSQIHRVLLFARLLSGCSASDLTTIMKLKRRDASTVIVSLIIQFHSRFVYVSVDSFRCHNPRLIKCGLVNGQVFVFTSNRTIHCVFRFRKRFQLNDNFLNRNFDRNVRQRTSAIHTMRKCWENAKLLSDKILQLLLLHCLNCNKWEYRSFHCFVTMKLITRQRRCTIS